MPKLTLNAKGLASRALDGILVVGAVAATTAFIVSSSRWRHQAPQRSTSMEFSVDDRERLRLGKLIGRPDAPVTLVEFLDYQCPSCLAIERVLQGIEEEFPGKVQRVVRHLPLSYHPVAFAAAVATFCASELGMFGEMHRTLFSLQDSLEKMPMLAFAKRANLSDLNQWQRCTNATAASDSIKKDVALAGAMGITSTPTLIVDGKLLEWRTPADVRTTLVARINLLGGK